MFLSLKRMCAGIFIVSRFQESGDSMARMTPENSGKDILVPLTGSMYVPGTLVECEKVVVDVGTGYYVEKDVVAAKDYFSRKVGWLRKKKRINFCIFNLRHLGKYLHTHTSHKHVPPLI